VQTRTNIQKDLAMSKPTKYPPIIGLNQAINIAREVHKIHSKERFNVDLLVDVLQTTKTSSYFIRRITAMQQFGLFSKTDETVQLTELAIQIVDPKAGEDREAKLVAFRKIEVLAELLQRYPNAKLPPDDQTLKSVLLQSMQIDRDTLQLWYDFVVDSFKAISGATERASEEPSRKAEAAKPSTKEGAELTGMKTSTVWLPSGKRFEFSVEEGYTSDDMEFVMNLLNLFKSSIVPKGKK
jgi:hypothetical protein